MLRWLGTSSQSAAQVEPVRGNPNAALTHQTQTLCHHSVVERCIDTVSNALCGTCNAVGVAANVADHRLAGARGLKNLFSKLRDHVKMCIIKSGLLGSSCFTEHGAAIEILAELTSLPQGEARLARLRQLSGSRFLDLLNDCRTRLAELGLATTYRPETDPE